MAAIRKSWAIRSLQLSLALSTLAGAYEVWARIGLRVRPWHLEAQLESRLGECRTGPGALCFQGECEKLAARAEEVKGSLLEIDQRWLIWRDYSVCRSRLLSVFIDAQLLQLRLALRQQEQKAKLEILLTSLRNEFGLSDQNGEYRSKYRIPSIEQRRARSLVEQAESLRTYGEVESSLEMALRAWISWQRFNHLINTEFARFQDLYLRDMWDQQAAELLRWTRESGHRAILIDKLEHRCLLINSGEIEKAYSASLSRNWYAQKVQEQDAATPEGRYKVSRMIAAGKYGMALMLDYPNLADRDRFAALKRDGIIFSKARIGGNVEIHGAGRPDSDWTDGCVSLNDNEMRELYRRAYLGMPVTIVGTSKLTSTQPD